MDELWKEAFTRGFRGVWSHPDPFEALDGVNFGDAGKRVPGVVHTIWQISRHMTEWGWILVKKLQGVEVKGVDEESNFFPPDDSPKDEDSWNAHKLALKALAAESGKLLDDFDAERQFPDWDNITAADALMVLITHNAYHTAQIVAARKTLDIWK